MGFFFVALIGANLKGATMDTESILHIPHSSSYIPDKYKSLFYLSDEELHLEQLKMIDSYTNELFNISNITKLIFPISRLICDVERFRNEEDEEMTKQGMWVCYNSTSDLRPLKKISQNHKTEILKLYYDKHHKNFENLVDKIILQNKQCLIIDAHSFSSVPLLYELHMQNFRPEICIGTDNFHTPKKITKYLYTSFMNLGYNVSINNPFCGTIVPLKFYRKNKNVMSVMIEINRSLYMDEKTGNKNKYFTNIKNDIFNVIKNLTNFLK